MTKSIGDGASLLELVNVQQAAKRAELEAIERFHQARMQMKHWSRVMEAAEAEMQETAERVANADLDIYRAEQLAKDGGIIRLI